MTGSYPRAVWSTQQHCWMCPGDDIHGLVYMLERTLDDIMDTGAFIPTAILSKYPYNLN